LHASFLIAAVSAGGHGFFKMDGGLYATLLAPPPTSLAYPAAGTTPDQPCPPCCRSDPQYAVRNESLHVWKSVVYNTPKTLTQMMNKLMSQVGGRVCVGGVQCLCGWVGEGMDTITGIASPAPPAR